MLKLAALFLVIMIVAGILGFVMHVAVFFAKIALVICLIGFVGSLVMGMIRKNA
jgi:uncharacterized membrane protein YtjA (UPF0391 family)